ncbi:hypothetical protein [Arthrobacter oryzae]|uniref:hypothetical protein n=1 Tax=Arthrobacter oryzae TaxID=409290 RepID=UPI00278124DD|nr:hypothetical protein [Arthrobacter oryzae]MDQ0078527.1 hypothetical protein [Arthrobacter oryzae]
MKIAAAARAAAWEVVKSASLAKAFETSIGPSGASAVTSSNNAMPAVKVGIKLTNMNRNPADPGVISEDKSLTVRPLEFQRKMMPRTNWSGLRVLG